MKCHIKNCIYPALITSLILNFIFCNGQQIKHALNIEDSAARAEFLGEKYNLSFYPISLAGGQMPAYCMEFRLVFECRLKKNNSILIGGATDLPGAGIIGTEIGSAITRTFAVPALFGGRANFEFRHYFKLIRLKRLLHPYIGCGASVNGMVSPFLSDADFSESDNDDPDWASPYYQAHLVMCNFFASGGCQFAEWKKRTKRYLLIDVNASLGGKYDYFWRHYRGIGNLEFERTGIYGFFKMVPICAALNVTVGGAF